MYMLTHVNKGFIYTQTTDRMWRKNRVANSGSNCAGTDLNRNWPYKWNGQGSSTNPCSETYRGSSAGSSVENKALTGWLSNLKKTQSVKLFIDWHSYSQLFMSRTCPSLSVLMSVIIANTSPPFSLRILLHCSSW